MDLEVNIKEEPAWLEETTNASLENIERVSEVIALKKEAKSELTEPESTQENSLEPSKDNKKEIFIEQHTDDQLLAYIKEETKYVHREASCSAGPFGNPGSLEACSNGNVEGLRGALNLLTKNTIVKYDICVLKETFIIEHNSIIIPGFYHYEVTAWRKRKTIRRSLSIG
ncbi:uncharacterized protein [Anabrus simplex]|uniref:uncharacterized protein n=1 Tax=Anabrus simplex TaxID=316456 RepID=UPI0035A3B5EF